MAKSSFVDYLLENWFERVRRVSIHMNIQVDRVSTVSSFLYARASKDGLTVTVIEITGEGQVKENIYTGFPFEIEQLTRGLAEAEDSVPDDGKD